MAGGTTFIKNFKKIPALRENKEISKVTRKYPFRCTEYYLNLIDPSDKNDPLGRIVLPQEEELYDWSWGRIDPSNENAYTVLPGLQHKYDSTVLLLVSNTCAGFCRYCFRKRFFLDGGKPEILEDLDSAIAYIKFHGEITNVILSGGDPLMLPTKHLERFISRLRKVHHVGIIRLGTKVLAYFPHRILSDPEFLALIKRYSTREKRIYIIAHFDHPRELTEEALKAIDCLVKAGATIVNQTPLIQGVNDDPLVLAELFRRLSFAGVTPYYVFQCRPAIGNRPYAVPIEKGYKIFETAKGKVSGLAKTANFIMSHERGKLEIVALSDEQIFLKFHRAADNRDSGKILIYHRNPHAYWLDDYDEMVTSHPLTTVSSYSAAYA